MNASKKLKLAAAGVIAAVLVAGGAAATWARWYSPEARAMAIARAGLLDPDSAKFDRVHYNAATGATCGLVNAKNRMGGYVGARLFIVSSSGSFDVEPDELEIGLSLDEKIAKATKRVAWLEKAVHECPPQQVQSAAK